MKLINKKPEFVPFSLEFESEEEAEAFHRILCEYTAGGVEMTAAISGNNGRLITKHPNPYYMAKTIMRLMGTRTAKI